MKYLVSLLAENSRMPNTFHVQHYAGENSPTNWFKLPINFVNAVQVLEVNKFEHLKNVTAEEISICQPTTWMIIFFDSENEFLMSLEYKLA